MKKECFKTLTEDGDDWMSVAYYKFTLHTNTTAEDVNSAFSLQISRC